MEHYYQNIQNWFNYQDIFSEAVQRAKDGELFVEIGSVIDNEEYLNIIALNGRQYYENNCTISSIANNAVKLINLDLLK